MTIILISCQENLKENKEIKFDLTTPKGHGLYIYELLKSNNKKEFNKLLIDTTYAYLFNDMRNPYNKFGNLIMQYDFDWNDTKYSKTTIENSSTNDTGRSQTYYIKAYFIDKRLNNQFYIEFPLNKENASTKYHLDPFQRWEMHFDRKVAAEDKKE
jgi:hypothetical protein